MGLDWKQWSRSDIIYGIVAPVLVVLLIVAISQLGRLRAPSCFAVSSISTGFLLVVD